MGGVNRWLETGVPGAPKENKEDDAKDKEKSG